MNDDDNLYFSFDDEEQAEEGPEVEESQNRSFLIGAIVLAAVFVLGICAVLIYLFVLQPQQAAETNDIALTNAANMTLAAATQTAAAGAVLPTEQVIETTAAPGEEPGGTVEGEATATSTPEVGLTVEVEEGTGIPSPTVGGPEATGEGTVEATGEATAEATGEAGGTAIAEVTQGPTPLRPAASPTAVSTSGIIEVTPLGGPTPTRLPGVQTPGAGGGQATPGTGGPIQPTAVATLPTTGSMDTVGLVGAGLLAVGLASVAMFVRYMRLK